MKHVIGVGACYIDTILTVPYYPKEDEKLRSSALLRRRGGNCGNTLEVLEQFVEPDNANIQLHLMTVLPSRQSLDTDFIRESFDHVKLDPTCIYRPNVDQAASCYIFRSQATDSRTIVNNNPLQEMTAKEFHFKAHSMLVNADAKQGWYHFEGRSPDVILNCIEYLRAYFPHFKISVELEKPTRVGLEKLAAEADVVFYSRSWAADQGYKDAAECVEKQSALTQPNALLCCTWGSGAAVALQKQANGNDGRGKTAEIATVEAWKPRSSVKIVDAVGAGDTFIAGMLTGLVCHEDDWTLHRKLEFANELAGRKVRQEGFGGLAKQMEAYKR